MPCLHRERIRFIAGLWFCSGSPALHCHNTVGAVALVLTVRFLVVVLIPILGAALLMFGRIQDSHGEAPQWLAEQFRYGADADRFCLLDGSYRLDIGTSDGMLSRRGKSVEACTAYKNNPPGSGRTQAGLRIRVLLGSACVSAARMRCCGAENMQQVGLPQAR